MTAATTHESRDRPSAEIQDMHHALTSLIEELVAVDTYEDRLHTTTDDDLRSVLANDRDEEKEHACMLLEWIRRRDPEFDGLLRRFLFRADPIARSEPARGDHHQTGEERHLGIGALRGIDRLRRERSGEEISDWVD